MVAVTLHVVEAFDADGDGNLVGREPKTYPSAAAAMQAAKVLTRDATGVIAWSRSGDPDIGKYGEQTIIFKAGLLPDEFD